MYQTLPENTCCKGLEGECIFSPKSTMDHNRRPPRSIVWLIFMRWTYVMCENKIIDYSIHPSSKYQHIGMGLPRWYVYTKVSYISVIMRIWHLRYVLSLFASNKQLFDQHYKQYYLKSRNICYLIVWICMVNWLICCRRKLTSRYVQHGFPVSIRTVIFTTSDLICGL